MREAPGLTWTRLHQVHGARVVVVDAPGEREGEDADAAVTTVPGAKLVILTADCAPLALAGDGVVGAVHAGWRGLAAGVIGAAVDEMRRLGGRDIVAALGPCIHAECYEFTDVADHFPPEVHGRTAAGQPALDLPAAVRRALHDSNVELVHDEDVCTACSPDHFSHRARSDAERQAMVVWMP